MLSSRGFLETGFLSSTVPACWLWPQPLLSCRGPRATGVRRTAADPTSSTSCLRCVGLDGGKAAAAQGCKYRVLLQGDTRSCLTHWVGDTTEPSSHMPKKSTLIDSQWPNIVEIWFVSYFIAIQFQLLTAPHFRPPCFLLFWWFCPKTIKELFCFVLFSRSLAPLGILLNQPGSAEKCAKPAAMLQFLTWEDNTAQKVANSTLLGNFVWSAIWHKFSKAFNKVSYIAISIFIEDIINLKQL